MRLFPFLVTCALLLAGFPFAHGVEDAFNKDPNAIEFPSPNGQYAFRYVAGTDTKGQTYDLINKASGQSLAHVAEADLDPSPSARFHMAVLWRADSKAFALTATLWKRGSGVSVFQRDGVTFHEIKLPELLAEISEKARQGKRFPHIVEDDSQTAKRWQKDGSLVVEIETIQDGDGPTITADRTVVLSFDHPGRASIAKSTIKFKTESE